jgi:hypothetical protein
VAVRRPELVVAAALVLSLPFLPSVLDGALSPAAAIMRFAIALVLCWALAAVVERVVGTYARQARHAEITRLLDEARARFGEYDANQPTGQPATQPTVHPAGHPPGRDAPPPVGGRPRS